MALTLAAVIALATQCAPSVAPSTLAAVAQVESRFEPLAIGVNGDRPQSIRPATVAEAVATATRLLAQGRNIDLGLGQINSSNLTWLGLSVEDAFDPCANLAAAARVLQAGFEPDAADGAQAALRRAFSRYNTGTGHRGFANGYVAKVTAAAAQFVPQVSETDAPAAEAPPRAAWDVFGETGAAGFLTRTDNQTPGGEP